MKKGRKAWALFLAALLAIALLSGCGSSTGSSAGGKTDAGKEENLTAPDEKTEEEKENDDIQDTAEGDVGIIETANFPDDYEQEADQQGQVTKLDYTYTTASGDAESKQAMVYLPYGYSDSNQYDVLYLMHGMGGTQYTFLGNGDDGDRSTFTNVVDHMIEDKVIQPVIIVAPTITPGYSDDGQMINSLCDEVTTTLMPLVESTYHTYADSTDKAGLEASRDHRAFGGFSMGACITWNMLWKETQYFRYYMPFSMIIDYSNDGDIEGTTKALYDTLESEGYTSDDFDIYAACGTKDYTNLYVRQQIEELEKYDDMFVYTSSGFSNGNLMYAEWPGHYHRYSESYQYCYCGLMRCFPGEAVEGVLSSDASSAAENGSAGSGGGVSTGSN